MEHFLEFIKDNLPWFGLAVFSGGMLLWQTWQARGGGAGVSPMQATLMINREDAVVVDVRESAEFVGGHIPNCASGNRSSSACGRLRRAGFEKVFNLSGGIAAWDQAGLPITKK